MGYKTVGTYKGIELRAEPGLSPRIYAYNGDEVIQIYDDTTPIEEIHKHLDELLSRRK